MFDFETTVSGIEFKVRQLADEVDRLRRLVEAREDRVRELEEALKNSEITINNLKEENKLVKLGNRLTEGNDSAELKLKINQMIRTLDRSLEILKGM
jgi:predicted RNase H-like nuclease (RuvC/YqgF family)